MIRSFRQSEGTFEYLIYLLAVWVASTFPLECLYRMAWLVANIHYFFDRKGREAVRMNLNIITEGGLNRKEMKKSVKQTYYYFSYYLAEFFRMGKLGREYSESHIAVEGLENIDAMLERGQGVVVVSSHFSNWELGLAALCLRGYPAYVIVAPHKHKKVNDLFLGPRVKAGARPIDTKEAIEGGYRALRDNGILILLGDRVTTKGGVETTFFGHTAVFPKGPAKFALGAPAPVVPAHIVRNPDNTFVLAFDKPILTDGMENNEESVRLLMAEYTKRFETYIRKDPPQYGVFYKIWKDANN